MPSRLPELRQLVTILREAGHQFLTVEEISERLLAGKLLPERTAVIRCDVDSDVRTAVDMANIVSDVGGRGTWYWRLSTLDKHAMAQVSSHHEIGYHFEELATVAKRTGAKNSKDILALLPQIRDQFARNLEERYLPAAGNLPKTVASHGDFANRFLNQTNSIIVDQEIRKRFGIIAEAYDNWLNRPVTRRFSDAAAPLWWKPGSPLVSPPAGSDIFYVLIHPRQYAARWVENTMLDIDRLFEGILYAIRRKYRIL